MTNSRRLALIGNASPSFSPFENRRICVLGRRVLKKYLMRLRR
jgi:hypothetical protein